MGQRPAARVDSFFIPGAVEFSLAQVARGTRVDAVSPPSTRDLAPEVAALAAAGIPAPLAFQIEVPAGRSAVTLGLRSNRKERPLPSVRWEARNDDGETLGRGEVVVEGWPVHQARWIVPPESASLVLRVVLPHTVHASVREPGTTPTSTGRPDSARGLSYDDLRVDFASDAALFAEPVGARQVVAEPLGHVAHVELAPTSPSPTSRCALGGLDSVLTLPVLWALVRRRRAQRQVASKRSAPHWLSMQ
ncbi:MAG: hypothetical protein JNJ59_27965 [Deltaproteobacteria bacterium]|nr:hypothetical protein [Deltaproteobacteria bacterium]